MNVSSHFFRVLREKNFFKCSEGRQVGLFFTLFTKIDGKSRRSVQIQPKLVDRGFKVRGIDWR